MPERLLLHVPPRVVWNGIYRKDRQWIEGLEKLMTFYSIKPYHLVVLEYIGGPSFNLKIFNPYGVEINYNIVKEAVTEKDVGRSNMNLSDIELDRLCGTLSFNVYNSGEGICDVVLGKRHLRNTDLYEVIKTYIFLSLL